MTHLKKTLKSLRTYCSPFLLTCLLWGGMSSAARSTDIIIEIPGYGGNGCPAGSASIVLSPDRRSFSVLFDRYTAEIGRETGKLMDRKTCNLAIPVHVPPGISVSLKSANFQGYASLPLGTSGRFQIESFMAGTRGPIFTKTFPAGFEGTFDLKNDAGRGGTVWSPCGQDVNVRINSSLLVQSASLDRSAFLQIEGNHLPGGPLIHLQWRRC